MWQKLIATRNDYALTVARLMAGLVMLPHGLQKTLGWFGGGGFQATMEGMTSMGLPAPIVLLVILGESLGALGLIVGAIGRFCAFGFVVIMLGAIFTAHGQHGFFMNWFGNQEGEGFEYHLLMIGLALLPMIWGSGALSIDRVLSRRS
ncbi:MAG: DoxX family protein [Acidobacteriota bacterium]